MTPPACAWLDGQKRSFRSYYEEAIEGAVRSPTLSENYQGLADSPAVPGFQSDSRSPIGQQSAMSRPFFTRWGAKLPMLDSRRCRYQTLNRTRYCYLRFMTLEPPSLSGSCPAIGVLRFHCQQTG